LPKQCCHPIWRPVT